MLLKRHASSNALQRYPDEELLVLYHYTSDNKFFAELFSRYVDMAFHTCLKYLRDIEASKDRVMDIFYQLLQKCKEKILRLVSFKSWLFIYIRNECTSYMRYRSSSQKQKSTYTNLILSNNYDDPSTRYGQEQLLLPDKLALFRALNHLPLAQQQCLHYFFFEKKSYRAIAQTTGKSIKEVKSHIQNGKRKLKIILQRPGSCIKRRIK